MQISPFNGLVNLYREYLAFSSFWITLPYNIGWQKKYKTKPNKTKQKTKTKQNKKQKKAKQTNKQTNAGVNRL